MTHPIDIPEVVAFITPFLSRRDLVACVQVSHGWRVSFISYVWQCIHLTTQDTEPENSSETHTYLKRHHKQIQTLEVDNIPHDSDLPYLEIEFPKLRNLGLKFSRSHEKGRWRELVWDILRQLGPQLRTLNLNGMNEVKLEGRDLDHCSIWRILVGFQRDAWDEERLLELKFEKGQLFLDRMKDQDAKVILQLDSLVLEQVGLAFMMRSHDDWASEWPQRLTQARIQNLVMRNCKPLSYQFLLLEGCRELRSLTWDYSSALESSNIRLRFLQRLQENYWSHLESLTFRMINLSDSDLGEILRAIRPLTNLSLNGTSFGRICTEILADVREKHWKTLKRLSLLFCSSLSGASAHRLLCSLPNLEVFQARELTAQSVMSITEPWVCKGLREFRVGLVSRERPHFNIPSLEPAPLAATVFLARLAELQHLEVFEILKMTTAVGAGLSPEYEYQRLRMDTGLDMLRSLRSMRELRLLEHTHQMMGLDEAQWMVNNWPELEAVYLGNANCEAAVFDSMKVYFEEHGVKCLRK